MQETYSERRRRLALAESQRRQNDTNDVLQGAVEIGVAVAFSILSDGDSSTDAGFSSGDSFSGGGGDFGGGGGGGDW
jgi:uncharacterized membrane protein YgcG